MRKRHYLKTAFVDGQLITYGGYDYKAKQKNSFSI